MIWRGLAVGWIMLIPLSAGAQQLDLSRGGPIAITATDGIDWRQNEHEIVAHGDARAVRADVTVTADTLTAWYRSKAAPSGEATPTPASAPAGSSGTGLVGEPDTGNSEIYKLQALGNVHIFTATDQAWADRAVYEMDQAVLVLTGHALKLTTPTDILTARDTLEYWTQRHMAVARGDAVVLTNDSRRVAADTLVAYNTTEGDTAGSPAASPAASPGAAAGTATRPASGTKPATAPQAADHASSDPLAASGKLQKVEAFGNVSVRTPTDTVTGDRGVYVPDTGIARVAGHVRITRGQNQLNGAQADVNMKTGIAHLTSARSERVHGLVIPNDQTNQSLGNSPLLAKPGTAQSGPGQARQGQPKQ